MPPRLCTAEQGTSRLFPAPPICQLSAQRSPPPRGPSRDCLLSQSAPPPLPIVFSLPSFHFLQSSFQNGGVLLYLHGYRLSPQVDRSSWKASCSQLCPCVNKGLVVLQTEQTSNIIGLNKKRAYCLLKKMQAVRAGMGLHGHWEPELQMSRCSAILNTWLLPRSAQWLLLLQSPCSHSGQQKRERGRKYPLCPLRKLPGSDTDHFYQQLLARTWSHGHI